MPPEIERVKINGIKVSSELVLIHLPHQHHITPPPYLFLLQSFDKHKINLPYITFTDISRQYGMSCCVSLQDFQQARRIITSVDVVKEHIQYIENVGTISIFPHQSRMKILGTLLHVIGKYQLTVYGLASSISSLFFITDYAGMDKAISCLSNQFDLPDNYTPIKES